MRNLSWQDRMGFVLAIVASAITLLLVVPVALRRTHTWPEFLFKTAKAEFFLVAIVSGLPWLIAGGPEARRSQADQHRTQLVWPVIVVLLLYVAFLLYSK